MRTRVRCQSGPAGCEPEPGRGNGGGACMGGVGGGVACVCLCSRFVGGGASARGVRGKNGEERRSEALWLGWWMGGGSAGRLGCVARVRGGAGASVASASATAIRPRIVFTPDLSTRPARRRARVSLSVSARAAPFYGRFVFALLVRLSCSALSAVLSLSHLLLYHRAHKLREQGGPGSAPGHQADDCD